MKLSVFLSSYLAPGFRKNQECVMVYNKFVSNIPKDVMNVEVDDGKTFKYGVKSNNQIYKYGLVVEEGMAFLEFFESEKVKVPTMSVRLTKTKPTMVFSGNAHGNKFVLKYFVDSNNTIIKEQALD